MTERDFVDSLIEEWREELPDIPPDGIPVVARIVRMSYYIERLVERNLAQFGLNRSEFEVLAALVRNPKNPMSPKMLQEKILISSGGLSNRINKLEERGLLTRLPDPTDRRGVLIEATPQGRELTLRARRSHVEIERRITAGLSVESRERLGDLLRELILSQPEEPNRRGLP